MKKEHGDKKHSEPKHDKKAEMHMKECMKPKSMPMQMPKGGKH